MKNVFLKTKYSVLFFCLFGFLLAGCPPVCPKLPPSPPNLIIIGEDLSGTYNKFPSTNEADIRNLCDSLSTLGMTSKIYFIGIGEESPKDYVSCTIAPMAPICKSATPGTVLKIKKSNKEIKKKNQEKIEEFVSECQKIFQRRNQKYTDINGFLDKAASVIRANNHEKYTKWLYINSDGKQDTKGANKVDCSKIPNGCKLFTNRGWENEPDCKPVSKILDTSEFIQVLMDNIRKITQEVEKNN